MTRKTKTIIETKLKTNKRLIEGSHEKIEIEKEDKTIPLKISSKSKDILQTYKVFYSEYIFI